MKGGEIHLTYQYLSQLVSHVVMLERKLMIQISGIIIRWLGQACYIVTLTNMSHVLIDPPHPQVGYAITADSLPADIVFVSHNHMDHNFIEAAMGHPVIVEPLVGPGFADGAAIGNTLKYRRIFAYHDNVQGAQRGPDTITVIETGGLRIVHLGDLGQLALTAEQIQEIGRVDVLMIPVGGFYTIDGAQAAQIVSELKPRVILPMHYSTPALNADLRGKLSTADAFLAAMQGKAKIVTVDGSDLNLTPKTLPKTPTVYLLKYGTGPSPIVTGAAFG